MNLFRIHLGLVLLFSVRALSLTYYVDSQAGNDRNIGTAAEKAWKSLAKVNAATFGPGDKILFKAGSRYTGGLAPKGSGKEGRPIIMDVYGKGDRPRIDGEGILATHHQKIRVIKPNIESAAFATRSLQHLGALARAAEEHDADAIRKCLNVVVPEYTPEASRPVLTAQ